MGTDSPRLGSDISDADVELDIQMSVRARNRYALLWAVGLFSAKEKQMPPWLAEALCSPWGREVLRNVILAAEHANSSQCRNSK